jgi:hypothetical protein
MKYETIFAIPTYGLGVVSRVIDNNDSSNNYYEDNLPLFTTPVQTVTPRPQTTAVTSTVLQPTATVTPKPTGTIVTTTAPKPIMTLKTVVFDDGGILPLATIDIDGSKYATNIDGIFQKTGVLSDAIITISYVGYKSFVAKASQVPNKVILQTDATLLPQLNIKPKPKNKYWWLLLIPIVPIAGFLINKSKEPKRVKAKI